jgi:hypothetical protein
MQFESIKLTRIEYRNRVIALLMLITLFLLPYFYNPFSTGILTCTFREWSGYPCPTCGMSRAFYLMAHFHFYDSLNMHLMGPLLYLLLGFILIRIIFEIMFRKKIILLNKNFRIQNLILFFGFTWFIYWIFTLIRIT